MKNTKSNVLKMRSILAIALVAVIGFTMTACGGGGGSSDSSTTSQTQNPGSGNRSGTVRIVNNGDSHQIVELEMKPQNPLLGWLYTYKTPIEAGETRDITVAWTDECDDFKGIFWIWLKAEGVVVAEGVLKGEKETVFDTGARLMNGKTTTVTKISLVTGFPANRNRFS